jgi:hypothetical protein
VLVQFTVPIYTAIAELTSFTLGYKPQLVVSNVGIDPTTVAGLLKVVSKGKAPDRADRRRDHRRVPPLHRRHVEPVDPAVSKDPRPVRQTSPV